MSRVLSFGTDRWYRRRALRQAGLRPGMAVLDVATGTGLVSRAALELGCPASTVLGLDPSSGMLAANRARHPVRLVQGRGEQLPVVTEGFDFVVMGYALRHVEDLVRLFREFRRVLRPGGKAFLLEISRPPSPFLRAMMRVYLARIVPYLIGVRDRSAASGRLLEYYWRTIEDCVPPATIVEALTAAGFDPVQRRRTGPMLNDYLATKSK